MNSKKKIAVDAVQAFGSQPSTTVLLQPDNHNKKFEALFDQNGKLSFRP